MMSVMYYIKLLILIGIHNSFSSPPHPYHHWGPCSIIAREYRSSFLGGKVAGVWSWSLTYI